MPINPNDVLRVVDKMTAFGQDIRNVYHLWCDFTTAASDSSVVAALKTWLNTVHTYLAPQTTDQLTYDSFEVFDIQQARIVDDEPFTGVLAGSGTEDALPLQVAPVILFGTATPRSQGRKFVPGFTEGTQASGGAIDGAGMTALANAAGVMLIGANVTEGPMEPCNWNEALASYRPWIASSVNPYFGTQRSRRIGTGT